MKILLIDDDKPIRELFGHVLQKANYELVFAGDGKSGLEKAKLEKPEVILLDQVLPDMSGNDILKQLKSDPVTQSIPVAMISNYSQESMMQEALNMGATDYILKYQIEPQDLLQKIERIMQEHKSTQTVTQ